MKSNGTVSSHTNHDACRCISNACFFQDGFDIVRGKRRGQCKTIINGVADLRELRVRRLLPALVDEVERGGDDDRSQHADDGDDDDQLDEREALLCS